MILPEKRNDSRMRTQPSLGMHMRVPSTRNLSLVRVKRSRTLSCGNAIKAEQFPWMLEVTKNAPQMAIIQLGEAFRNFFVGRARYPRVAVERHLDDESLIAVVAHAGVLEDGEALAAHVLLRGRDPQISNGFHGLTMEYGC